MDILEDKPTWKPRRAPARRTVSLLALAALLTLSASSAQAVPIGDYGDAPDSTYDSGVLPYDYPSVYDNGGPYHLDTTKEWIGLGSTSDTTTEADSLQVDLDASDHGGWWIQEGSDTWFMTHVSYDPLLSSASDTRYLNLLADLNGSGQWDPDAGEWVVQNLALPFDQLPAGVQTMTVLLDVPDTIVPADIIDDWMRLTLSDTPVPDGTGAWGEFARGETEDWVPGNGYLDAGPIKPHITLQNNGPHGNAACPQCGVAPCRGVPLCNGAPGHGANIRNQWTLNVPNGVSIQSLTVALLLDFDTCQGQTHCPHTSVSAHSNLPGYGGLAAVPQFPPARNLVPGRWLALPAAHAGGVIGFDLLDDALMQRNGHANVALTYWGVFDPGDEYVFMTNEFAPDEILEVVVPEPGTLMLLGSGLLGLAGLAWRRGRKGGHAPITA